MVLVWATVLAVEEMKWLDGRWIWYDDTKSLWLVSSYIGKMCSFFLFYKIRPENSYLGLLTES